MLRGRINRIIDSSVVDGPGNRTALFFQGCNLNCFYCHNPETINHCIDCGLCVPGCPSDALAQEGGNVFWTASACIQCDACIRTCPYDASPKILELTVAETLKRVARNQPFIKGITTSGGECTLQHPFLTALFRETRKLGLTNFVDTNGTVNLRRLPEFVELTDGFMLDVKAVDREEHLRMTKHHNDEVLENLVYLAGEGKLHEVRTVVIEGYDNRQTIRETSRRLAPFVKDQHILYKIIRFRPHGVREAHAHHRSPHAAELDHLRRLALENGMKDVLLIG